MRKEKTKLFDTCLQALDFIDGYLTKQKVKGDLHAPNETNTQWSVTYKLPERENSEQEKEESNTKSGN